MFKPTKHLMYAFSGNWSEINLNVHAFLSRALVHRFNRQTSSYTQRSACDYEGGRDCSDIGQQIQLEHDFGDQRASAFN